MTLKEFETWHRREAEGLLRSAQATDRRGAYDALAVKGAKDSRDRARWHLAAADSFGVNRRAMTMQAAKWKKLIARFDPR
jgi:hypothetical protein